MVNRNNLLSIKVDFENTPGILFAKNIRNEKDIDRMVDTLKLKLFGK